jgi:hypothetical protein
MAGALQHAPAALVAGLQTAGASRDRAIGRGESKSQFIGNCMTFGLTRQLVQKIGQTNITS